MKNKILSSDPDIFGGTPIFKGTRIPVSVLFQNLADGMSLDQILDTYPTLSREAACAALRDAELLLKHQHLAGPQKCPSLKHKLN